eukprot:4968501-Pyramimonas_sp.AAC.1
MTLPVTIPASGNWLWRTSNASESMCAKHPRDGPSQTAPPRWSSRGRCCTPMRAWRVYALASALNVHRWSRLSFLRCYSTLS